MKFVFRPANILLFAGFFSVPAFTQQKAEPLSTWAYDSINIPLSSSESDQDNPVLVAVVDDAFRLTHQELEEFIYKNPREIPGNQLDDDGNNYVDDVYGWDISDHDPDVSVPEGRSKEYYHGTYVSSIITSIASLHYGDAASRKIKIMPVKVLSNQASQTYLKDGYRGIRYAMENGADIICLAWSGGNPGPEDLEIIREASNRGILLISSAGNFNEEQILHPAIVPEVLAVSGINRKFQKEEHSNYGMQADIAAPAEQVRGAHPEQDNAYIQDKGTSAATALVSGCAAVILSKNNSLKNTDLKEALMNASTPFPRQFSNHGGKLGAGILNLANSLDYEARPQDREKHYSSLRSKGSINILAESNSNCWEIEPAGGYQGFDLEPDISKVKKPGKHSFRIVVHDSVWNEYKLSNLPPQLFVPSASLKLMMEHNSLRKKDLFKMNFQGKTVDSTRLFCSDTRYLDLESGSIEDGSGEYNYADNCSCRWIITVPPGKRIKFTFDQMDTQANVDFVYLVDGRTAVPDHIIAKFSGQNIPPVVFSRTNEVLVWFVSDKSLSMQGWRLSYETVD